MQDHDEAISTLAAELGAVEEFVRSMSSDDWSRPTLLEPFDAGSPPWSVKELVAPFKATVAGARQHAADTVGSGYFALMRLDEWIPSRTVEAVVHGLDLTDAVGAPSIASAGGVATTTSILDELLARRTVAGRPADLGDDVAFIRVASGRAKHMDPRFPLVV